MHRFSSIEFSRLVGHPSGSVQELGCSRDPGWVSVSSVQSLSRV